MKNTQKIKIFGPFIGELGWEILRWSGYVRKYKLDHPEEIVCVSTRKSRKDLYSNCIDILNVFEIKDDYNIYRPNMYSLDFDNKNLIKNSIIRNLKCDFTGYDIDFIFPFYYTKKRNVYDYNEMDFNYEPSRDNKEVITNIIKNKNYKKIITISPRNRIDLKRVQRVRNWNIKNWYNLYHQLSKENILVFITGCDKTFIRPLFHSDNFIILEDLKKHKNTSLIGLTIECIKYSNLVIGQQSSIPVLSNLLKIPTLMWGDEKIRHMKIDNPHNTKCIFLECDSDYDKIKYDIIFENILNNI